MSKKLAILFPGIGYNVERPLLYYSRKLLQKNGYKVISVKYTGLEKEEIIESAKDDLISNGVASNRISKEKLLQFVAKAKELATSQLQEVDFSAYDKLIFVSKSVGSVISAIYAKQAGLHPYHIMITPLDYAFQFAEDEIGSVFCGTNDSYVNFEGVKNICKTRQWDFHEYKSGNHSLETGDINIDVDYLKNYVSIVDDTISDMDTSIYDYELLCRNQQTKSMSDYKGKVLLIVNTATGCGFTPQYQGLEEMYGRYKSQGFEILDFPCNQFGAQAPGTEKEIYSFCTSMYDITFEQFAKIHVNGEKQSELFKYLKSRKGFKGFDMSSPDSKFILNKLERENPDYEFSSDIKWNFTKFLVNRKGQVIERFEPTTDLKLIEKAIQQIL